MSGRGRVVARVDQALGKPMETSLPPFEFTARERWLSSLVLMRGRRVARELGVTDGELDALAAKVEAYREAGAPT